METQMKKIIVFVTLCSNFAVADDFDQSLASVKKVTRNLDLKLKKLGIRPVGEADKDQGSSNKESDSFIQVYSSERPIVKAAGDYAYGKLETRLVVSTEQVPVVVRLNPNQGVLSGLKVLGSARPGSVESRIDIDLTRLVLRSGAVRPIQAVGLDKQGAKGIDADVVSSKALAVAGALAGSFVSGLALGSQTQETNGLGFSQTKPTGRNAILQGVAQTAADQSKRVLEESTKEKPILIAEPGETVVIYFSEEWRS
jgi:hypothetical protein